MVDVVRGGRWAGSMTIFQENMHKERKQHM